MIYYGEGILPSQILKTAFFYLSLRSALSIFDFVLDRLRLGIAKS